MSLNLPKLITWAPEFLQCLANQSAALTVATDLYPGSSTTGILLDSVYHRLNLHTSIVLRNETRPKSLKSSIVSPTMLH